MKVNVQTQWHKYQLPQRSCLATALAMGLVAGFDDAGAGLQSKSFCLMPSRLSLLRCLNLFSRLWLRRGGKQGVFFGVAVSPISQRSLLSVRSIILILILQLRKQTVESLFFLLIIFATAQRRGIFIAQQFLREIIIILLMKHILVLAMIALAIAQFSPPDFGHIGETIKNGVVSAEQSVQHFAKEEVQIVEKKINEGIDKIGEIVNPPAPAPAPVPAPEPAPVPTPAPSAELPKAEVTVAPAVVQIAATETATVDIQIQPSPVPLPEAKVEAKPEEVKPAEQKDKKEWEHKRESKHSSKPHHRQEKQSFTEDVEARRAAMRKKHHEMKQKREKHEYTPEELEKKREEREKRIKEKEEHMKEYERKHKNIERNEEISGQQWKQHGKPQGKKHSKDPKVPEMAERVKLIANLQTQP